MIAFRADRDFPLVIAANRDEFHARPTQAAHWWSDVPDVLGGRDLQAGGTWLALHRNGRFAAVTNYRDAERPAGKLASRGHLVSEFLQSAKAPLEYAEAIDGARYGGFNLLVGDTRSLAYRSNRDGGCRELAPGIYGVANATLDVPWPKVERSKARLEALVASAAVNETTLFRMLADRVRARTREVEAGELPFETAHALTAPFVCLPDYGTRSSTVVIRGRGGVTRMTEKRFRPDGRTEGQCDFSFEVPR